MEGALLLSLSPALWIDQITATTTALVVHLVSTQTGFSLPVVPTTCATSLLKS